MRSTDDIAIEQLNIAFGEQPAVVKDVSLRFVADRITAIVGESGSGKSLLAMSILQLLGRRAQLSGHCWHRGRDYYQLSKADIKAVRGQTIALIPQNPDQSLNPVLTVGRQLLEVLQRQQQLSKPQALQRIRQELVAFDFADPERIIRAYPFQMSGGMKQRILTVMSLLNYPQWVIADEPTKGLDVILKQAIYQRLVRIAEQYTKSMILITHDLLFAHKIADYIAVMFRGELLEYGPADRVLNQPLHPYTQALIDALPSRSFRPIAFSDYRTDGHWLNCPLSDLSTAHQMRYNSATGMYQTATGRQVKCEHNP